MKRKNMWWNERAAVRRRKEVRRRKTKTRKGNRAKLRKKSWKKTKKNCQALLALASSPVYKYRHLFYFQGL